MPRINLLPWREQERKVRRREFMVALGAAAIIGVVCVLFGKYVLYASWIDAQNANIQDLENRKQRLVARMEIIEKLQRKRPEIVHLFDELVKTVPEGIYLTQIKETGKKLEMKGVAQSSTRVSTFMRNIDSSSWMDNPQLQVVEVSKDSPTGGSSFMLSSDVIGVDVDNGGETTVKKVAAK